MRHDRVRETNDPTAHAVIVALREAARKLGTERLTDATIFATLEPCPMCVGALLESDVEALVFAVPNTVDGAAGTVVQLAQNPRLGGASAWSAGSGARRPRSCSASIAPTPSSTEPTPPFADRAGTPARPAPAGPLLDSLAERCPSG